MTETVLSIRLEADGNRLTGTIKGASKDFKGLTGEMDKASKSGGEVSKSLRDTEKRAVGVGEAIKRAGHYFSVFAAYQTVKATLTVADSFATLEKRVESATRTSGNYLVVSERIKEISRNNGAALEGTVSLFQGISRVRTELNVTDEEILSVSDSLQKLGALGGSSTAAMSAGLMQFSQAMADGIVRAEEMNSIVDNMPEAAAAIAAGMGMTVGELQAATREGKILSREVFAALIEQAPEIAERFEEFGLNLERSGNKFQLSIADALANMDRVLGITRSFAKELNAGADSINLMFGNPSLKDLAREIERLREANAAIEPNSIAGFLGIGPKINTAAIDRYMDQVRGKLYEQDPRYRIQSLEDQIRVTERRRDRMLDIGSPVADSLDQRIERLRTEIQAAEKALERMELGAPDEEGDRGADPKSQEKIREFIQALKDERDTLDMTTAELARYAAAKLGASASDQTLAYSIVEETEAQRQLIDQLDEAIAQQDEMEAAYDARMEANSAFVASLEDELALQVMSDREREIEINLRRLSTDAKDEEKQSVVDLTGALYDQQQAAKEAAEEQRELARETADAMRQIERAASRSARSAEDAWVEFAMTGKLETRKLVDTVIEEFLRLQFRNTVGGGLSSALSQGLGMLFGPSAAAGSSAEWAAFDQVSFESIGVTGINAPIDFNSIWPFGDGGVMTRNGPLPLHQYGDGGVVNKPQVYVAGERYQEEAIIPLKNGSVPVMNLGGGGNVTVQIIEAPGRGGQVQRRRTQEGERIEVLVEQFKGELASDVREGGSFAGALESTYGLNRSFAG